MDTREEKQSRNAGEAVRGRSRKKSGHFKLSPSKAITISALLAAGLLSAYGLSKHRTAVKTQNIYTEELLTLDTDEKTIQELDQFSKELLANMSDDSFEKTHKYLIDSSNSLINKLNHLNQYNFNKYFEAAGIDTNEHKVISIKIDSLTKDLINPQNQAKDSYYLVCGTHYINANDIETIKLEADLRDIVYNNKDFSEKKLPEFKKDLVKCSSDITIDKLSNLTIIDNNSKVISLSKSELNKKAQAKEKDENDPFKSFLYTPSSKEKEHLQNIRTSKLKNISQMSNVEIDDENDPDLHQPIDSKNTQESEHER